VLWRSHCEAADTLSSFSRRLAHLLSFQFVALGDQVGERRLVRNFMPLGGRQQHSEHVRLEMRSLAGENALLCGLPPLGREQKPRRKRFYFLRGLVLNTLRPSSRVAAVALAKLACIFACYLQACVAATLHV